MSRPIARRDFLLDSSAVTHLAADPNAAAAWLREIANRYDEPSVLVPVPVISECRTGDPRRDAPVDRLFSMIAPPGQLSGFLIDLTRAHAERAAVLRTRAISGETHCKARESVTDAHVVAMAEERNWHDAASILTSDPNDLRLPVDLTGAKNIGVIVV